MNLLSYFIWHFARAPRAILKIIGNYLLFCEHYFSISLLLKTLFSPWKRITFEGTRAFSLNKYFEVVLSNLISRILGAIVRTVIICVGISAQIIVVLLGFTILIIFLFLPFITIPIYFILETKNEQKKLRHSLFKRLSEKPLPNLSNEEILKISKTAAGQFLFTRLQIRKDDIVNSDLFSIVKKYGLSELDVYEVIRWYVHAKDEEEEYSAFWELFNLLRIKPIGRDWAYGYTVNLDNYSNDLVTEGYGIPHLVGRWAELDRIQRVLSGTGVHNVLMVGDPGSGRHAIVLAFALDVFEGKVNNILKNKRVIELNLNLLVSEAKVETEIKGKVTQMLKEAVSAGNIICVIDNFEKFTGLGKNSLDLTDVFTQVFARNDIQVIGITDRESYHKAILPNSALNKIFEVVEISEISKEDALKVLEHLTPVLEKKYNLFIPYQSLTNTIKQADLIGSSPNPEKSIDILKEAAALSMERKSNLLSFDFINQVVSQKTKTPVGGLLANEKEKLQNLESLLHESIIDQEQAINEIAKSLRRARLEISGKGKPLGTFLFLGPTGVGKTETAKTLARVYFGSEKQMVRFDMSQYQGAGAIDNLLGFRSTSEPGALTSAVRDNPFTVVLLDEIEKASPEVLNVLLPILDEGYITDNFGRKVSFENTLIIGTSNAGSEFIRSKIQENPNNENLGKELTEYVLREKIFTPEFINRFDGVVVYKPLTEEHLRQIARLMLTKLNKRLEEKRISVNITTDLVEKIAKAGYDPQFGARPMKRVIAEKVEDYIAQKLLNNEIKTGDTVTIAI